ncbi:MAG TPA: peptidase M14, partial [bacterium]|nr:peptidase M14 [bacterium]
MTSLLDERVPRTLEVLLSHLERSAAAGSRVEAWLFEGTAARRDAEHRLHRRGVAAVVRSAYKPLVHFFLEEVETGPLRRATVHYPIRDGAHEHRFRLEAYPLSALLQGVELRFIPAAEGQDYRVDLERSGGSTETHTVFAPNRMREDHLGARVLAPTGWLRITEPGEDGPRVDEPVVTEYETIFERAINAVRGHDWGTREPYFDQLVIHAELPDVEHRLPYGEECLSTSEALHEDLYFSTLEFFKHRAGRPIDDRTTRPGQIVPDIRQGAAAPSVRVTLEVPSADEDAAGAAGSS